VSEPPEDDQDGECEDVGVALVSIRDILMSQKDPVDEDIPSKSLLFIVMPSFFFQYFLCTDFAHFYFHTHFSVT